MYVRFIHINQFRIYLIKLNGANSVGQYYCISLESQEFESFNISHIILLKCSALSFSISETVHSPEPQFTSRGT